MLTPRKIETLWREVSKHYRGEIRISKDVDRSEVIRFARLVEAAVLENAAAASSALYRPRHSDRYVPVVRAFDLRARARASRKAARSAHDRP